jgi:small subunit ribosomal protein S9
MTRPNIPTKTKSYVYAVGRRKTSVAVVKLVKAKQADQPITVNDRPIEEYFPGESAKTVWQEPFRTTNTFNVYSAGVSIRGGGKSGQLDAFTHAVSRALVKADPEKFRSILKKRHLLTRDPRMKERRKPGLAHKARAGRQSPKR